MSAIWKRIDEKDEGFTLIELLVVVIIIGILAAIAIPLFLNQRESAQRSQVESDLRSVAVEAETFFTRYETYPDTFTAGDPPTIGGSGTDADTIEVRLSSGTEDPGTADVTGLFIAGNATEFCMTATHEAFDTDTDDPNLTYQSTGGGIQDWDDETSCSLD